MKKRDYIDWRKSRIRCKDNFVGSISPLDRLYEIIKKVKRENPRISQEIYIHACEYKD